MAPAEAYWTAEQRIEEARRSEAKYLNLKSLHLDRLPKSIGRLAAVQSLNLSDNRLSALPEILGKLTQLRSLTVFQNNLVALPESLGLLTQLEELDVSHNRLTTLPGSLGLLAHLKELDLSHNQLSALPKWLELLIRLRWLNLANNELDEIPSIIKQLRNLVTLYVSDNQIRELPKELGRLKRLKHLTLQGNQISHLPPSIGLLSALRKLYLGFEKRGNPIVDLPFEIKSLTNLTELDVSCCPDLRLPPEIVAKRKSPREILDYYFSTRGDQGAALRELKLLVVGRGGGGKTSLIKRLNRQSLDPDEGETHGINISPLELKCFDGAVTARVWDFGGQHVLHAMHEFFLTARSLYLLVLGEREDMAERDAAYWLQMIRSYVGEVPVVVALNKSWGRPREMDRESLERNYGPILAWVPTECAAGYDHTIENLREALTQAADGMPEVRDLFPSKWWKVKEWLEKMDEPYLDFATYLERCKELGEKDPQEQEILAARLNDLGIAINYGEDERLHDTTVLRPDWLANGIYSILRANDSHHLQPLAPDAVLTVDRLGPIFTGAERLKMLEAVDYPKEKWPFLLRLMNLFQLAFPIDESGATLLVPTLLPVEPPKDCEEPNDADRTRLRYEFAVVPGPLLPKLLVRTFSLIKGERRWRRGAILQFGEARARVWATQDERWVHITAAGHEVDRSELLTMIRVTLQELFAEYRNLQAVEQWEYNGKWVPRETLEDFGALPSEKEVEQ